ncbi:MAG: hypothetical protein IIA63_00125 [Nitrospinae bacterium]|nr:hypothetical protein [Nitrospinota bacterium]MCH8932597.1 hypothetical protein [Nitrospinota bacterium]
MRIILPLVLMSFLMAGCSDEPEKPAKYHFGTKNEYLKYYLPLQDDHGGVRKWVPSQDMDCRGGKVFTHGDGFQSTFCPANGNEDLFK